MNVINPVNWLVLMRSLILAASLILTPLFASAETLLMMGREPGCVWCARWDEEIRPIYPKTTEAEIAPLFDYDIRTDLPEGITLDRPIVFTPTFVVLEDGVEIGRIEGYPGEDFFWGLLDNILGIPIEGS